MPHKSSFTNVIVHLVWATKYRAPVLSQDRDDWLARIIKRKGFESGCQVFAVGNGSDHLHTAVRLAPTLALSELARRMKGASSRLWNLSEGPRLFWQNGYWAESVHPEDLPGLCHYIETQRKHHRGTTAPEPWTFNL